MTDNTIFDPPTTSSQCGTFPGISLSEAGLVDPRLERARGALLTAQDVEDALVEAIDVRLRSQRGGHWPFASDGPWHLIEKDWEQYVNDALAGRVEPVRKGKPGRAALALMRVRLEWLLLVAKDDDRRLLVLALTRLAKGHGQVPWGALVEARPRWRTPDGLRMRYGRALSALTAKVNRLPRDQRDG